LKIFPGKGKIMRSRGLRVKKRSVVGIVLTLSFALVYKALLDYVYTLYIVASFPDELFAFDVSTGKVVQSFFLTAILAIAITLLYSDFSAPSRIVIFIYFTLVIVPLLSLYGLQNAPSSFIYIAVASFVVLMGVTRWFPRIRLPRLGIESLFIALMVVIAVTLYVYGQLISTGGLGRLSFNLDDVYTVRSQYGSEVRAPLMGYLVPWQGYVLNVALFVYALYKRSYGLMFLSLGAQFLLFGMTNFKAFLFAPVLVLGFLMFSNRTRLFVLFLAGISFVVSMTYLLFLVTGEHMPPSLFIRRLLFVPANNHLLYYGFFSQSQNPHVLLSNSMLSSFVENPYRMSAVKVIAHAYWGRDFSPNVGYLGDAYAQFGFVGMMV
jgi:hypothetical protein